MVKLRLKVGPKGQIIIPKPLREAYNIREGGTVIIEPREDGILIKRMKSPEELVQWIKERKKRIKGLMGKLGELAEVDLETEFD
ncbi:MAG: AbrB/MazE/SpoVT family DNA-binding domain-containing protein [Candidatus Njordarchaeales archaeon]